MDQLTNIALNLPVVLLVLFRAGGIMVAAPLLSNTTIPARIKIVLTILITVILYPLAAQFSGELPTGALAYIPLVIKEFGLGLIMGFAGAIILATLQIAGSIAAQQIGLSASEIGSGIFDDDEESDQVTAFFGIIGLLLFLAMDGHHWFIEALAVSFRDIPLGEVHMTSGLERTVNSNVTTMFIYALKCAAPLMTIMFLVNVVIAIMAKTVPQMNILMVGYPVKVAIGVMALIMTFPLMWPVMRAALQSLQGQLMHFARYL